MQAKRKFKQPKEISLALSETLTINQARKVLNYVEKIKRRNKK